MTKEQKQLWDKISHFKIDDENIDFTFSKRLARENNWTLEYSKKVIDEYKKFIFLCCVTKTGVTPSDQVDQAWHLHHSYTKSYWIDFCKNTLEKEIHHNPTKGGNSEAIKFDDFYSKTKEDYREYFNEEPPIEIWPSNENRFSDVDFRRVNTNKNWIIKKPTLSERNKYLTLFFFLTSIFLVQATFLDDDTIAFIIFIVIILLITYYHNKKNKNGSGCSSGCTSGCSTSSGHHSCSGDSGCSSSGCSGCGGGCGGGD